MLAPLIGLPTQCFGLGARSCQINAAGTTIAIVDARLVAQLSRPARVQLVAQAHQPLVGGLGRGEISWRQDAGPRPRSFTADGGVALQHADAHALTGQLIGQRQADDASAQNQAIVHPQWLRHPWSDAEGAGPAAILGLGRRPSRTPDPSVPSRHRVGYVPWLADWSSGRPASSRRSNRSSTRPLKRSRPSISTTGTQQS